MSILKIHKEVLGKNRLKILEEKIREFKSDFIMGGGTAIALQIGHRESFDFDMFSSSPIPKSLLNKAKRVFGNIRVLIDTEDELTFVTRQNVKITFLYYPFSKLHRKVSCGYVSFFHLYDLASSKAYTIGRRGEYKDYIDLYFLLKYRKLDFNQILAEAKKRFGTMFNKKLLFEQLVYYEDMTNFEIEFIEQEVSREEVEGFFVREVRSLIKK